MSPLWKNIVTFLAVSILVALCALVDVAVVVVALTAFDEGEWVFPGLPFGGDREHLGLAPCDVEMINAVAEVKASGRSFYGGHPGRPEEYRRQPVLLPQSRLGIFPHAELRQGGGNIRGRHKEIPERPRAGQCAVLGL